MPVDTINLADIQSQTVHWTWEPYIPTGSVTVLLGDGGIGKSFLSLAIAAAITRGAPLPGNDTALPPSDVIIQNAENPLATVVKPRLEMLGADCSKVHIINESESRLTLTDERIEAAIIQHNARLIIADPVQSYLGTGISMNRAESVRLVLTRLEQIAERTKSAFLLVGHLNKGNGKAQYRGLGSVDIFNSVPSVLYLGKSDEDADARVMVHGKSNLDGLGASLAFSLKKPEGFRWIGECDVTLDELLAQKPSGGRMGRIDEAEEFLRDALFEGGMSAADIFELAEDNGISEKTLKRAKKNIGIKTTRVNGHWFWSPKEIQ